MKLNELLLILQSIRRVTPSYNNPEVVIKVKGKTFPGTPKTLIKNISQGIDWDNGLIFINPEDALIKKE